MTILISPFHATRFYYCPYGHLNDNVTWHMDFIMGLPKCTDGALRELLQIQFPVIVMTTRRILCRSVYSISLLRTLPRSLQFEFCSADVFLQRIQMEF